MLDRVYVYAEWAMEERWEKYLFHYSSHLV